MKPLVGAALAVCVIAGSLSAAELPGHYFKLLEAEVRPLEKEANLQANAGAMLSSAVLYARKHPANPAFGDRKKLELALRLRDLYADLAV
jgi:hypothetical protein